MVSQKVRSKISKGSKSSKTSDTSAKKFVNAKDQAAESLNGKKLTTAEMVIRSLTSLNERNGSSLQAIKKYITSTFLVDAEKLGPQIKKFLRSAVENNNLIQTRGTGASGSFKIPKIKNVKPKETKSVTESKKSDAPKVGKAGKARSRNVMSPIAKLKSPIAKSKNQLAKSKARLDKSKSPIAKSQSQAAQTKAKKSKGQKTKAQKSKPKKSK